MNWTCPIFRLKTWQIVVELGRLKLEGYLFILTQINAFFFLKTKIILRLVLKKVTSQPFHQNRKFVLELEIWSRSFCIKCYFGATKGTNWNPPNRLANSVSTLESGRLRIWQKHALNYVFLMNICYGCYHQQNSAIGANFAVQGWWTAFGGIKVHCWGDKHFWYAI